MAGASSLKIMSEYCRHEFQLTARHVQEDRKLNGKIRYKVVITMLTNKRAFIASWAVLALITLLPGCAATSRLSDSIDRNAEWKNEFRAPQIEANGPLDKSMTRLFVLAPGHTAGTQLVENRRYRIFEFHQVLEGTNRMLRIAVPDSNAYPAIVSDRFDDLPKNVGTGPRVQPLIVDASSRSAPKHPYKRESDFVEQVRDAGSLLVLDREHRYDFVNMIAPGGLARHDTIYMAFFSPDGNQSRIAFAERGAKLESMRDFRQYNVVIDIDWHARSRLKSALLHSGYLVSVPVDIMTFPVQAVVGVLFGFYGVLWLSTGGAGRP
jgi:hypothetical protein